MLTTSLKFEVERYFSDPNIACPNVTSETLSDAQVIASFMASICPSLTNEGKDKLIRFQEVVYLATVKNSAQILADQAAM